jgi:hypothetical protein
MTTMPASSQCVSASDAPSGVRAISARYWTCAGLLLLAAIGFQVLPPLLRIYLQKLPVPLKEDLPYFDPARLAPRYERHPLSDQIGKLSDDMVETLGTENYYQVYLRDPSKPESDPTHLVHVFLTYYTGKPNMVPHVPDECYVAGGYDRTSAESIPVSAAGVGAPEDTVPVRLVRFVAPQAQRVVARSKEVAVAYFFHANDAYETTRNGVRLRLSNPFARYAYYLKVEVNFTDVTRQKSADGEQTAGALGPLLEVLMPVLFEHHLDLSSFASDEPEGSAQPE